MGSESRLYGIVTEIVTELAEVSAVRDRALQDSRLLTRLCANSIRALHRHDAETAADLLTEAREQAAAMRRYTADCPTVAEAPYLQDALKELVEASLLMSFVMGSEPPAPEDLCVTPATYLGGLAEAGTELRRYVLDLLRQDREREAEDHLNTMDEIYDLLLVVDLPSALTNNLRRRTDVMRGVLERTRSDVANALRQRQLRQSLDAVSAQLGMPTS